MIRVAFCSLVLCDYSQKLFGQLFKRLKISRSKLYCCMNLSTAVYDLLSKSFLLNKVNKTNGSNLIPSVVHRYRTSSLKAIH